MRTALFDSSGGLVLRVAEQTPKDDPNSLTAAIASALAESGDLEIADAVVGVPGPVHYGDGMVLGLPKLPGWEGKVSAARLSESTGLSVQLANDADLAALGEHRFGAGVGTADMVYVTSSTGVGAGVIIGGRLLRGNWSLAEAGHMIIDRESDATVEDLGSGTALGRIAGMSGAEVTKRAEAGDEDALEALGQVAEALAVGVYNLVQCFMPERVVVGGGVSQAGELLLAPIRRRLTEAGPTSPVSRVDVVKAQGGDDVGLLGAYAFWRERVLSESSL